MRLFRPYRPRLGLVVGLIVLSAGMGMVSPFLLRDVLDNAIPERDTALLTALVLGMVAIAVATGALGVAQTWLSNVVGQRVMHDLRAAVYRHLQRLSLAFFTRTRTGEVQSRIANDIGGIDTVVTSTATSIAQNVTTGVATTVAMVILDRRLAVFTLALLPFFVWLSRRVGEERRRITSVRQGRLADLSSLVEESLSVSGVLLGKTMGRSAHLAARFSRESEELAALEVRQRMAGRWRMATIQMTFAALPAAVYWFAGQSLVAGSGAISIGTVVAFTTLQTRMLWPVAQLLSVGVEVQSSLALFDRIFEYLDTEADVRDAPNAVHPQEPARGAVALRNVGFEYVPGRRALDDVTFEARPGQLVALVGPTGAGKTTVTYLIPRFYDVTAGSIEIDGRDVRDVTLAWLRTQIGIVTQETYLFNTTVRDNLRYARPEADDDELMAACRAARLDGVVTQMPNGLDTEVGERG
ncbi:MAG: ATP-binding cassette, subfamily bacterial [Miltoncostaeaceae bacterium]|nr:ATP-binding cassette, subfamily bacterial [Miltoncostaeaceae bacterium]